MLVMNTKVQQLVMNTNLNLSIPWQYVVGMCDNWYCSRIGLLKALYYKGDIAAHICIGHCLDEEDTDGNEAETRID